MSNTRNWMFLIGALVRYVLLPLVLAFLAFSAGLYLFAQSGPVSISQTDRYDILRDTLTIVLAVAAFVITVLGAGAFAILRAMLRRDLIDQVNDTFVAILARNQIRLGHTLWQQYSQRKESFLLRLAIQTTAEAHEHSRQLNMRLKSNEELDCIVRNNWAYYLAEKARISDEGKWEGDDKITHGEKVFAMSISSFLEQKIPQLPEQANDFIDSITYIRRYCGSNGDGEKT